MGRGRLPLLTDVGDLRYDAHYRRLLQAADRAAAMRLLADDEVVQALAAASRAKDALLANVLATEAMNRMRRSRVITENVVEGAFAVDTERRLVFVNPALAKRTRTSWQDAIGRHYADVVPLVDETGARLGDDACPVLRAMERREVVEWVGRVQPVEGDGFPAMLTVAPVEREGSVDGAVGTVRDITETRRLLARYRSLFAELDTPTFFLDESGTLLDLNPAAARVLRLDADDARGAHFSRFVAEADIEAAAERFARVLDGERRTDDYAIVRADGTRVLLRVTGIPMRDEGGIVGMHGLGEVLEELPGGARTGE